MRTRIALGALVWLLTMTAAFAHGHEGSRGGEDYWRANASNWDTHHCNKTDQSGCKLKK